MNRCFRLPALVLAAALCAPAALAQVSAPLGGVPFEPPSAEPLDGPSASAFGLGVPYPNPFTETATLTYALDRPGPVRLELFDALGRRVAVIEDDARAAGEYRVRFNGDALTPGLYIVRLTAGDQVATRRLVRGT